MWLEKYGSTVNNELFYACEQVTGSQFSRLCCSLEEVSNFIPPGFPEAFFANSFRFNEDMCRDYAIKLNSLIETVEAALSERISEFEDAYWHNACLEIGYARRVAPYGGEGA